jgi:phage gp46-like protein
MNTDELYLQLVRDKDIYPDPEGVGNKGFWAVRYATGLAGYALNRLRRFRPSGAHPYRKETR